MVGVMEHQTSGNLKILANCEGKSKPKSEDVQARMQAVELVLKYFDLSDEGRIAVDLAIDYLLDPNHSDQEFQTYVRSLGAFRR
jgi:hypothetical protein